MSNVIFNIKRFDPQKDKSPSYKEYRVVIEKGATVLDVLNYIKWTQDGTLTFRMSCRSAICGSCAVRVNGRSMLACNTQVSDVINSDNNTVTIEPLKNLTVIKDLVVDMEPFWKQIEKVSPWLKPQSEAINPLKENYQSSDDFYKINDSANCIMCGSCYSDCTVLEVDRDFYGPTSLAKAQRFAEDSRDNSTNERAAELSKEHGIWDCAHCFECVEACPKGVKPLEQIVKLRSLAMKEGVTNNNGARHAIAFYDIVKDSGLLDENKLPMKSISMFNIGEVLSLMPVGIRMLMAGKLPPICHKSIDRHEEVTKIFEKLENTK